MYITHIISIVTLKIFVGKAIGSSVAPSKLLVSRIGPCYGVHLPISVSEMAIMRKQFSFTVSGQLNVSVDVANGWSIKGTMQKCHDIRNLDTCDHYRSLTVVKSGCDGENEGDQRQQEKFARYVTPRMECPLRAGVYQISNYPFLTDVGDLTAGESKISTSVFGYTYRLDGFDEDYQKIMCVDAFLKHIYVRKHNWIGNQKVTPVKMPAKNRTANDAVNNKHDDDDDEVKNDDVEDGGQSDDDSEVKTKDKHVNNDANDDKQEDDDTKDVKQDDDGNQDDNAKDTGNDDDGVVNNDTAKDVQNDEEEGVNADGNDGVKNDEAELVQNDDEESVQNEQGVNADDSEDVKDNEAKAIQNDDDSEGIKNDNNADVTPKDAEDVKHVVDGDANDAAETEAPNTQSDDENDEENEE